MTSQTKDREDVLKACRAEFEKWFKKKYPRYAERDINNVDFALDVWLGWKAAWLSRPESPTPPADAKAALDEFDELVKNFKNGYTPNQRRINRIRTVLAQMQEAGK